MLNFVMLDMPDFVLVPGRASDAGGRAEHGPEFLNPLFNAIFQALGMRMEAALASERPRFGRVARRQMEPVLRRYGFPRLPRTLGELCGLFDYCDRLDVITGLGLFEPQALARWRQLMFELSAQRTGLPGPCAIERYRRVDSAGLLAWHSEHDVLFELGRNYRYLPGR